MNTVIHQNMAKPPDLEVSIQAAAVLLSLAMRDTESPVQDLGQSLSRLFSAVTSMRNGVAARRSTGETNMETQQLESDLSLCIQSLQFHDRLIQQLAAVRNLLASLGPHGTLDLTGFSAKRWDELLRMLRDRLSADQHHQLFDLLMRNGEMDDELRGEILPTEGSVELF
jgi:hypothetical protein